MPSGENIKRLQEALLEFEATRKSQLVERRKQAIYNTWLGLLTRRPNWNSSESVKFVTLDWSHRVCRSGLFLGQVLTQACLTNRTCALSWQMNGSSAARVVSVSDDSVLLVPK